jgi:hypothetical protein
MPYFSELPIRREFPRETVARDHFWIPLADGTRLNARVWLPADAESDPVPVILEASPYRLTDGGGRDWEVYPYWAGFGYACVRLDLRGTGDSDGVITDEYTAQEHDDVCEAIAWLAAQPWSTGAVGMTGISWTGFNSLQVAARRPPALKAIITLMSTDDRYADDVHYKGGCVSGLDMLPWGGTMLHYDAIPRHPQVSGQEGWREDWMRRLEANEDWTTTWLAHQRRDEYWRHGSVCEDYAAIEAAVYAIGGWTDGYHNAVLRLVEGLPGPAKGLVGPWAHCWPHDALPGPAIGYLQEALRWWDHWLKGIDTGIMDEPALRVWMEDFVAPGPVVAEHPGRWVAEEEWPSPRIVPDVWVLNAGTIDRDGHPETTVTHRGLVTTGIDAGAWCSEGTPGDWPADQRAEDGRSVAWTSAPLAERLEVLGFPEVTLQLAVDKPQALICVRLCDVAPDGCSKLVTRQVLNLSHRNGHEDLAPMTPGQRCTVTVRLDSTAHAFPVGHRLRVAVSTDYWPWVWPSPEQVTLTVFTGGASGLVLPGRPPRQDDDLLAPFAEPEISAPLESETLVPPGTRGDNTRIDQDTGTVEFELRYVDGGRYRDGRHGIETEDHVVYSYSITEGDPLSAVARATSSSDLVRGEALDVHVETVSELRCDATDFILRDEQHVCEHGEEVFVLDAERRIPRDHV